VHSSRTDRTKRSACGLQFGLLGGILVTAMFSHARTASNAAVNLVSRSRMRWVNSAALSPSCTGFAGLAGLPRRRWGGVGGDAEDVNGAGADLHGEQGVETLQSDGVLVKEVRGEEGAGLGFQECRPLTSGRVVARCGSESGLTQDAADAGCADLVAEAA
jgi:hypothetical protein